MRAFGGDDPIATAGKVSSEPPPPLDATIGTAPVVRSLNAALAKGVAKDLGDRFASCVDLGEAVARAIERPAEGAVSIDSLLGAASAAHLDDNGPASERIELERTPLSSRMSLERAARRSDRPLLTPYGETPARPSIIIRKQTHRLQNVAAAAALIVIVLLIVLGKRQQSESVAREEASAHAMASATAAPRTSAVVPATSSPKRGSVRSRAALDAADGGAGADGGGAANANGTTTRDE